MKLEVLRDIGKALLEGTNPRLIEEPRTPITRGAAGDNTYPIDRRAEEIIIGGLEASGEPLTVISEEAGVKEIEGRTGGGKKIVLIDPIDGSRNAIAGIPFYCTSIAVSGKSANGGAVGGGDRIRDIELAYVLNLTNGDEFWAERGGGAYLNGRPIRTQEDDVLYLAAYEAQTPARDIPPVLPLLSRARKQRCFGATALDLAYLAAGSISVFVTHAPSRSFDFAGGWLLVKEAGGIVTDLEGNDIGGVKLDLKRSAGILAAGNDSLHREALGLLKPQIRR